MVTITMLMHSGRKISSSAFDLQLNTCGASHGLNETTVKD